MSEGKLCTYLKVEHNFGFENYLTIIKNFEQRKIFTRFRISAHRLRIELGRCQGTLRQDSICLHCSSGEVEDEIHYLLNCEKFKDERSNLIFSISLGCPNFIQLQNMEKFIWMMNSEDHENLLLYNKTWEPWLGCNTTSLAPAAAMPECLFFCFCFSF
jgi:hypothetical protein